MQQQGRQPVNADQVRALYAVLWDEYIVENQHLLPDLINAAGVSDMFCQAGHACQATELWRIRATAVGFQAAV